MKKVMVLALAVGVLATPALASIKDSKHDLSTHNIGPGVTITSDYDELCVFCHTPHAASTAVSKAPLWNRGGAGGDLSGLATTDLYDTNSLTNASKPSAAILSAIQDSDAPLCLSCHDGTAMAGGIIHQGSATGSPVFTGGIGAGNDQIGGRANIMNANKLKDDHPIGMVYDDVVSAKSNDFHASTAGDTVGTAGLPLFGGRMWCASCHAVHGVTGVPSFLRTSNNQSALCLNCHDK